MRTLPLPLLLAAACSAARPAPPGAVPACDALSLIGAADPQALAADAQGGLAVAGGFSGQLRAASAVVESAGGSDAFVLRTAPDGAVRWLRRLGGAGEERAEAVSVAANGDVVAAGSVDGRCFVVRLAAAGGREAWRLAFDAPSSCRAVAEDAEGEVWAAGCFSETLFRLATARGGVDAFVARISGERGAVRFLRGFGGLGRDVARALAVAPSGDVIAGGQFGGEVDVSESGVDFGRGEVRSAGDFDAFVVALRPDGATRWALTWGDSGDDDVAALAVNGEATVFAAGHHQPAANYQGLVARDVGNYTAQVVRVSALGSGEWVRIFAGPRSSADALAFDGQGRLWAAGSFEGELRADGVAVGSAGKSDVFAVALSPIDGAPLGARAWGSRDVEVAQAMTRIPGGIALAGTTRGELDLCGRPIGSPGDRTAFLVWQRDLN